jgi:predicted nucleic acid-binding protein
MKFLVDTNILSEPTKLQPNVQVEKWITRHEARFYTSSLVMAEMLNGLEKLPESARKRRLAQQIEKLVEKLGGRILSFNLRVAREWVRLQKELRSKAHVMPWEDSMIAATARHHGLTLATHNTSDFVHGNVRLYDPFTYEDEAGAEQTARAKLP